MIKITIVEDNPEQAAKLEEYILCYAAEYKEEINVDIYGSGMDFLDRINVLYDIIFMDVMLPHMNGLDCTKKYRALNGKAIVIFVTNYGQYAVNGYEVDAMDYILKPTNGVQFMV